MRKFPIILNQCKRFSEWKVQAYGKHVNHTLVKGGWCWWYRKYAPGDTVLEGLEKEAQAAKKGLWIDTAPIPPWAYRKARRGQAFDLSDLVPLDAETEGSASTRGPPLLGTIEKDSPSSASTSLYPMIGNLKSHIYPQPPCLVLGLVFLSINALAHLV
jgi:hypothetical protein